MCFFTGFDSTLMLECSKLSIKRLKSYFAALVIISIIWFLIGYKFSTLYVKLPLWGGLLAGMAATLIIIMIERQIMLQVKSNTGFAVFRVIMGIITAFIGATIIDQILFQDDIERKMLETNENEVEMLMPVKIKEFREKEKEYDKKIQSLDSALKKQQAEMEKRPFVYDVSVEIDTVRKTTSTKTVTKPNPAREEIEKIRKEIKYWQGKKDTITYKIMNLRQEVENEVKGKKGFLTEIKALMSVIWGSTMSIIVYLIFFAMFLVIELLVVLIKSLNKTHTDYEMKVIAEDTIRQEQILRSVDPEMRKKIENQGGINKEIR